MILLGRLMNHALIHFEATIYSPPKNIKTGLYPPKKNEIDVFDTFP